MVKLTAQSSGELIGGSGKKIYSALLALIQEVNPELSKKIHDFQGYSYLTVSSLNGQKIDASRGYSFRITTLDEAISSELIIQLFKKKIFNTPIMIGNILFNVHHVILEGDGNKVDKVDIKEHYFSLCEECDVSHRTFKLNFTSPTFFKVEGRYERKFSLETLLKSLINKLKQYHPELFEKHIQKQIVDEWYKAIEVKSMRLTTEKVELDGYYLLGFKGSVVIEVEYRHVAMINLLLTLAKYSGVGAKCSIGFGQFYFDTLESKRVLLFFSHRLTEPQIEELKKQGVYEFIALPSPLQERFSNISPENDDETLVEELKKFILTMSKQGDKILIQGEWGVTYSMVSFAKMMGRIPLYSATHRYIEERTEENIVYKSSKFEHVKFKLY